MKGGPTGSGADWTHINAIDYNEERGHYDFGEIDWDEFWRLTGPLASNTPIFPALGEADIQRTVDAILEYALRTNSDR